MTVGLWGVETGGGYSSEMGTVTEGKKFTPSIDGSLTPSFRVKEESDASLAPDFRYKENNYMYKMYNKYYVHIMYVNM